MLWLLLAVALADTGAPASEDAPVADPEPVEAPAPAPVPDAVQAELQALQALVESIDSESATEPEPAAAEQE